MIYINDIYHDIIMIFSSENIMIYIIENINPFSLRFYYYLLWKNESHRYRLHYLRHRLALVPTRRPPTTSVPLRENGGSTE